MSIFVEATIVKMVIVIKAVMMFPPPPPICRRRLSRKKRFLKFSSEKHISQDTSRESDIHHILTQMDFYSHVNERRNRKAKNNINAKILIPHDGAIERNSYSVVSLWSFNLTNSDCFDHPIHKPLVSHASALGEGKP